MGGIEELLDWDMGLGVNHPDYVDLVIPNDVPVPVNFDISMSLNEQVTEMGFGQINAPIGLNLNADYQEEQMVMNNINIQEEVIQRGALFADEAPFADID